jgi:3-dehydroquinate synthase
MCDVVARAIRLKLSIVERDEREGGLRRLLNLGHTLGHAIEKCTHELNHGEAVAVGMNMISEMAMRRGVLAEGDYHRIATLLQRLGFNLDIGISIGDIIREVKYDKKKHDNILRLVLPEAIGRCRVMELPFDEFEKMFL